MGRPCPSKISPPKLFGYVLYQTSWGGGGMCGLTKLFFWHLFIFLSGPQNVCLFADACLWVYLGVCLDYKYFLSIRISRDLVYIAPLKWEIMCNLKGEEFPSNARGGTLRLKPQPNAPLSQFITMCLTATNPALGSSIFLKFSKTIGPEYGETIPYFFLNHFRKCRNTQGTIYISTYNEYDGERCFPMQLTVSDGGGKPSK